MAFCSTNDEQFVSGIAQSTSFRRQRRSPTIAACFTPPLCKGMTHVNGVFRAIYCEACQAQVKLTNIQQPVFLWHPAVAAPRFSAPRRQSDRGVRTQGCGAGLLELRGRVLSKCTRKIPAVVSVCGHRGVGPLPGPSPEGHTPPGHLDRGNILPLQGWGFWRGRNRHSVRRKGQAGRRDQSHPRSSRCSSCRLRVQRRA